MVMRKAVEWKYLAQNQLAGVKLLKENPWRLRYLQPGELRALLASAHGRLRPILILGVWTGLRLGEILQLAWDDVDVEHQRLLVRGRTKNREPRSVPLLGEAVKALGQISTHPECAHLFWHQWRGKVRRVRPRLVQEWFAAARVAAGIHNVRLHDLRHTYGSYLAVLGTPSKVIQELMGHKSLRMTERYMHIAPPGPTCSHRPSQ